MKDTIHDSQSTEELSPEEIAGSAGRLCIVLGLDPNAPMRDGPASPRFIDCVIGWYTNMRDEEIERAERRLRGRWEMTTDEIARLRALCENYRDAATKMDPCGYRSMAASLGSALDEIERLRKEASRWQQWLWNKNNVI